MKLIKEEYNNDYKDKSSSAFQGLQQRIKNEVPGIYVQNMGVDLNCENSVLVSVNVAVIDMGQVKRATKDNGGLFLVIALLAITRAVSFSSKNLSQRFFLLLV
jgi:hypothetical protein